MTGHRTSLTLAILLTLSTLVGSASAGTPADPEVTDPSGDTYDTFLGMPDTSPGTPEVDITAAWFREVGQDRYRITIEVEDLTDPGVYRLGKNINMWRAEFTTQGHDFNAFIIRNADGETRGAISVFDVNDGEGAPRTEDGTASVEIDANKNHVSLTLPREWSVETEEGTLSFSFTDGTELTDIVIRSYDGQGVGTDCFFCVQLDDTDPVDSSDFTFGGNNGGGPRAHDDNGHGNDEDFCDDSNPGSSPHCGALDPVVAIGMFCVQFPPPESARIC